MLNALGSKISDKPLNNGIATFLNPYSYLVARRCGLSFDNFDRVYADGVLFQKLLLLAGINVRRVSFDMTSLAPVVFLDAMQHSKSIFFVGGEAGIADSASKHFISQYPGLIVLGTHHGYFKSEDDCSLLIANLVLMAPDIVIVGMGAPHQERFLIELISQSWMGAGFTCGGFLHQTCKHGVEYYPRWANKLNLRFLYRMYDEPKLIRRYVLDYPVFIFIYIFDVLAFRFGKLYKYIQRCR